MAGQSVVRNTGQVWKLVLALGALIVGSFAPIWPETGLNWWTGSALAIAGYVYGLVAIRCPRCGSRWFWSAAIDAGLYGPLMRESSCPACKHDFARPPAQV